MAQRISGVGRASIIAAPLVLAALVALLVTEGVAYAQASLLSRLVIMASAGAAPARLTLRAGNGATVAELPVTGQGPGVPPPMVTPNTGSVADVVTVVAAGPTGPVYQFPADTTAGSQVPATQSAVPSVSQTGVYTGVGPNCSGSLCNLWITGGSSAESVCTAIANFANGGAYPTYCGGPTTDAGSYSRAELVSSTGGVCTFNQSGCGGTFYIGIAASTVTETRTAADNNRMFKVATGGGYARDTSDPDMSGSLSGEATSAGNAVTIAGKDPYGNPVAVSIKPNGAGGTTVSTSMQTTDANGNSQVVQRDYPISGGKIVGQGQTTVPNATINPITGLITQTTPEGSTTPVSVTTGSPASITFPDDYARENTLQTTNTKLQQLHTDLTDTAPTAPSDPTAPTGGELAAAHFAGTFTSLLGWTFPSHTGTCPDLSFDWGAEHIVFDHHCTIFETFRAQLSTWMLILWAVAAMFIVLGA